MTFSYDPTRIGEDGTDRLRFELGDTVVDMAGVSAALCDEEYQGILAQYAGRGWRRVRFEALKAIVMKLSFEVDTSVGGLSYSLSQRFERWKRLLDEEKKTMAALGGVPVAGDPGSLIPHPNGETPYYYNDIHRNYRRR